MGVIRGKGWIGATVSWHRLLHPPRELCTVDEGQETVRASVDEDTVKNSPYLDSALDLSSRSHASGVRGYYGL